jgi:hypothetical protein
MYGVIDFLRYGNAVNTITPMSVSEHRPWTRLSLAEYRRRVRASLEPACQIARQVVTVDVDRWAMAWAATIVLPAGEFSSSMCTSPPSSSSVSLCNGRRRAATSSFIPASPRLSLAALSCRVLFFHRVGGLSSLFL